MKTFSCLRLVGQLWRYRLKSVLGLIFASFTIILVLSCFLGLGPCKQSFRSSNRDQRMEFAIETQWNSHPVNHNSVKVTLSSTAVGLKMKVFAPFFNDPASPLTKAGQPSPGLWDFEVVEAFFLNDRSQYLEVELCPHGQHLVLLLDGVRKPFKDQLPLDFKSKIDGDTWTGTAVIPWSYFPRHVTRFNAYAIHGSAEKRIYEALYPVSDALFNEPNFHRLEYFKEIKFDRLWPADTVIKQSEFWDGH